MPEPSSASTREDPVATARQALALVPDDGAAAEPREPADPEAREDPVEVARSAGIGAGTTRRAPAKKAAKKATAKKTAAKKAAPTKAAEKKATTAEQARVAPEPVPNPASTKATPPPVPAALAAEETAPPTTPEPATEPLAARARRWYADLDERAVRRGPVPGWVAELVGVLLALAVAALVFALVASFG